MSFWLAKYMFENLNQSLNVTTAIKAYETFTKYFFLEKVEF